MILSRLEKPRIVRIVSILTKYRDERFETRSFRVKQTEVTEGWRTNLPIHYFRGIVSKFHLERKSNGGSTMLAS